MNINDKSGPAFPITGEASLPSLGGLSKREYFAAVALQGLVTRGGPFNKHEIPYREPESFYKLMVTEAYLMADEMLKEGQL